MRIRGRALCGAAALVFSALLGDPAVAAATVEPPIRIDYHPPVLQVEATDVPLADVLRALGKRVGFLVIEAGDAQPPLTVSLRGSVEQVLSELLAQTSHALVYGPRAKGASEPSNPIEAVVLLGAGSGGAVAKTAKKLDSPPATVTSETSAWLGAPMPDDTPEITRLLRDQAVATIPPSPESQRPTPAPLSAPEMMRQVQQNVQTLVDALKATSQALMDSVKNTGQ